MLRGESPQPDRETGVEYVAFQSRKCLVVQFLFCRPTSPGVVQVNIQIHCQERRREFEAGYNNVKEVRQNRIRTLAEIIVEYLIGYRLRYRSASFAENALGHVSRLLGSKLVVDINEAAVLGY
jgi:hypothetical protein